MLFLLAFNMVQIRNVTATETVCVQSTSSSSTCGRFWNSGVRFLHFRNEESETGEEEGLSVQGHAVSRWQLCPLGQTRSSSLSVPA